MEIVRATEDVLDIAHRSSVDDKATEAQLKLADMVRATQNIPKIVPGCFLGDKAAEAQLRDNLRAGRIQWRAAHNDARHGLEALDRGDLEIAEAFMREAERIAAAAQEAQMTAANYRDLVTSAERRGRRVSTADRNRRLAAAYDEALAQGKKGRAARIAAKDSAPDLKRECEGMKDSALKKAIERGQKTGDKE